MTKEWGKGREHGRIITKAVQNDIEKKNLQIFDSSFMKLQMHCDKSKIQSVSAVIGNYWQYYSNALKKRQ